MKMRSQRYEAYIGSLDWVARRQEALLGARARRSRRHEHHEGG